MAAAHLYELAAAAGEPVALFNLGYTYEKGLGVDRDPEISVQWYDRAAVLRNAAAQKGVADFLEDGLRLNGHADVAEAMRWYAAAAAQGYPLAQSNLGCCLRKGRSGVPPDY